MQTRLNETSARDSDTRVLLVEDDPGDVDLVRTHLERSPGPRFHVTVATRLEEAIEKVRRDSFGAILPDLSLPDSDGLETLARLRASGARAAIVVMTGNADRQVSLQAAEQGADAYLTKREAAPALLSRTLLYAIQRYETLASLEVDRQTSEHLATHDPLTGIPNRLLLMDRLEQAIQATSRTGRLVGLLFIDIDGFKAVNDQLGHAQGDELLRIVSERLRAAVRTSDTVARLGGDEFVVLLTNVSRPVHVERIAHKIRESLSEPVELGGRSLRPCASIGTAVGPPQGRTPGQLLRIADQAMYRAKRSSRPRRDAAPAGPDPVEAALARSGVAHGPRLHTDLELTYRARLDVQQGSVCALDVMPRVNRGSWAKPISGRGLIALAEQEGMGAAVFRQTIDQLMEDLQTSEALRAVGRIGIPLVARQVLRPCFAHQISELDLDPGIRLELFVPTSLFTPHFNEAADALRQALPPEVTLALDHRGAFDPVITALKQVRTPSVRLRLEPCAPGMSGSIDDAFLSGLASFFDSLSIRWCVDGIEEPARAERLHRRGCRVMQGPLFGAAVALRELTRVIEAGPSWLPGVPLGAEA